MVVLVSCKPRTGDRAQLTSLNVFLTGVSVPFLRTGSPRCSHIFPFVLIGLFSLSSESTTHSRSVYIHTCYLHYKYHFYMRLTHHLQGAAPIVVSYKS